MTKRGNENDSQFAPAPTSPGWRDDPERPGVQRYWTGQAWDDEIPPRPTPEPAWKGARAIALGILIAAAFIFTSWRMMQPSAADCEEQRADVFYGIRDSVESACVGR